MTHQEREKAMFEAVRNGDWNQVVYHGKAIPSNWEPWSRLPSASSMNDEAVNKVLDTLSKSPHKEKLHSFLFELASTLDQHHLNNETLNRVADLSKDDHYVAQGFIKHPNYIPDEKTQSLKRATDFWSTYENQVSPHHFATIKSMFTNKPEKLTDHRGFIGRSDEHMHLIPDLKHHAQEVQNAIMKDRDIPKQYFKGEPHVQLHRGVNGHYGKAIWNKTKYNPKTKEIDNKTFKIPTAHLTSWSTDPDMASRFAWNRSDIEGQPKDKGVVLSQWVPVKQILHSGYHTTAAGQKHPHAGESEIVIGHPEGNIKVPTKKMKFQDLESPHEYELVKPTIRKFEIVDEMETLEKKFKSFVPAMTALAMLGAPQVEGMPTSSEQFKMPSQEAYKPVHVKAIKRTADIANEGLKPIQMIESSGGLNTNHETVNHGVNAGTRAAGSYGLMPLTIMETLNKHPNLMHKYPGFKGLDYKQHHDKIHELMRSNPQIEVDVANTHWKRLNNIFGHDTNRMAYAWKNGITGAMKATDEEVAKHPYVHQYNKFKQMMQIEKPKLHKHDKDPFTSGPNIEKFTPFTEIDQSRRSVKEINDAIQTGHVHDLSNVGKFTHDSFVAGFDPKNSWLIKLEDFHERPSIQSAKYGLQVVKEVAFYNMANRVFDLGQFTPHAILGELTKDQKRMPAVAIRMYPKVFIAAHDMDKNKPNSMRAILEKYRKSGDLHKLSIMLYVLGEADAHGRNLLVDPKDGEIKLIDHGTSFADMTFNPEHDPKIFVPYILRAWGFKNYMTPEQKDSAMPKIENEEINQNVTHWVHNLDAQEIIRIANRFELDPKPILARLKIIQKLIQTQPVDKVINALWTKSSEVMK